MVFSSPVFLFLFLPAVLLFALIFRENRIQNFVLLIASLLFYAWGETVYVLIMLASIIANYLFGIMIAFTEEKRLRNAALGIGMVFNLGLLVFFKYANFLTDQLDLLFLELSMPQIDLAKVHLPIGISFFTFQSMSYIVDVHRRTVNAQRNPLDLALYIALFPQLIAGPIVRYHDLVDQLKERKLDINLFTSGVKRFVIGLAKKVIVADTAAYVADGIFVIPVSQVPIDVAWLGIICYALQIYFDFSGYSDMAIGLGRMFGFKFLENFNFPYIARSIRDFWRRWHISLSNWFRDYLYIPLGGNRGSTFSTYRNLLIVFFLTGLWHGASWNFIIWGLIHGLFLVIERSGFGKLLDKVWSPIRHLYTLLVVIFAWVFFRVETINEAFIYIQSMVGVSSGNSVLYFASLFLDLEIVIVLAIGTICTMPIAGKLKLMTNRLTGESSNAHNALQFSGLILLCLISCMYLASSTYSPFIYFRF